MSLQYVIDGYNIINHPLFCRSHKNTGNPRSALLAFIKGKRLAGSAKNKVILVFDGFPAHDEPDYVQENISVIFSRKINADEKIKKIVEETAARKNMVIVTNDKEIRLIVRSLGARVLEIEEFIKTKDNQRARQDKEPDKQELNYTQIDKINRELKKLWLG